ncbi:hypothetical protein FACS1894101_2070 [Betaproteobacteria bacterium]|nr:hypothetical protein FACS1894101_2070 [Betaproteobacteria bacterium]
MQSDALEYLDAQGECGTGVILYDHVAGGQAAAWGDFQRSAANRGVARVVVEPDL